MPANHTRKQKNEEARPGILPGRTETVEKLIKEDIGKEDMVKETQEGCLSRSISLFLRTFKFVKTESACRKDFFDKLSSPRHIAVARLPPGFSAAAFSSAFQAQNFKKYVNKVQI